MQYKLDQSRLAAKATSNGSNGTVDGKLKRTEPIVENFPVTTLKSPVVLPPTPVVRLNTIRSVPNSTVSINQQIQYLGKEAQRTVNGFCKREVLSVVIVWKTMNFKNETVWRVVKRRVEDSQIQCFSLAVSSIYIIIYEQSTYSVNITHDTSCKIGFNRKLLPDHLDIADGRPILTAAKHISTSLPCILLKLVRNNINQSTTQF